MAEEYVSGDNYEILRQGNINDEGTYCILDGGPTKLIVTVPESVSRERISTVFSGPFDEYQWGFYHTKKTRRNVVPITTLDDKLVEECLKRL